MNSEKVEHGNRKIDPMFDNVTIMNIADNKHKQCQPSNTVKLTNKEKKVLDTAKNREINLNRILEDNKLSFYCNILWNMFGRLF